ncbi:MAG: hypothetical protein K0R67_3314, partial [Paenibacillus sp.]|nr:hypothetical protein [Paenibacillus sp.]
ECVEAELGIAGYAEAVESPTHFIERTLLCVRLAPLTMIFAREGLLYECHINCQLGLGSRFNVRIAYPHSQDFLPLTEAV